ncbi:hypothetical protein [Flavobacterium silvaticum]|uniref:Uncharacterized protein n=1 Tax=Flavobacterium silvaticum TaxID=1852020 RepID=A0A972FKM8_9FLAO|nr:hypothetical protein [Flavobacterium silvaticum]NMH26980.1 hypothetical protein [Flavobacterium silvaticum]
MNTSSIILFLSLFIISCNKERELQRHDINGRLIVYNEEVYANMWAKNRKLNVTVVDTFCINQKTRASDDIKNGKLIYFSPPALEFEKLKNILKVYGIETRKIYTRCARLGGFEPYCYEIEMQHEIEKRYGRQFIDSLSEIALKEFVIENPDQPWIKDGVDLRKKYNLK